MQADLANARELEIASYCMDEDRLFRTVEGLLPGCKVNLHVDKEMFGDAKKKRQKPNVRKVHKTGAKVNVLRGKRHWGSFRCKALIINRRIMYFGGSNFTEKSHENHETTFRATGQCVADVLADVPVWRAAAVEWDGKS